MNLPLSRRIAVAVAVLVAAASPARAGVIGTGDIHSDPVFTGPDVTFAAAGAGGFRVMTYGGGLGQRWAVSVSRLTRDAEGTRIRLAGAGSNRVLAHTSGLADRFGSARQDSLILAPARGRAATLAGCADRLAVDEDAFAADARRVIYAPRPCGDDPAQRVVIRQHSGGAETELPVEPSHRVSHLRAAGKYVAFTDYAPIENATTLRVFDADTRTEIATIAEPGSELGAFALQDDGVVALCLDGQIVEYPLDGGTRTLPESQCEGPLVAGDAGYLSVLASGRPDEAVLGAYSAGKTRTVARLYGDVGEQGLPAMHAKLAAFRRRFCGGWEVVTVEIGTASARAERHCEGTIAGIPRRVRGGSALAVPVRCPQGCTGTVTIRAPGHPESRRSASIRLSRRGTGKVTLPLTRAAQRGRVKVALILLQPPFESSRTVDRATVAGP